MKKKKIIIIVSCCVVLVLALVLILTKRNKNNYIDYEYDEPTITYQEDFEQKSSEYTSYIYDEFYNNYIATSDTAAILLQYSTFYIEPIDNTKCIARIEAVDMRKILENVKAEFETQDYENESYEWNVYNIVQMIQSEIMYEREMKKYEVELEVIDELPVINDDFINCMYGDIFALYNEELETGLNKLMSKEK